MAVQAVAKKLSASAGDVVEVLLRGKTTVQERREHLHKIGTRPPDDPPGCVVFEDFSGPDYRHWYVTGEAFGDGPSQADDVLLQANATAPIKEVVGPGIAQSGLVAGKLQGVLRSRTFTLDKPKVLYRIAGMGGQVNLIIDGFQMIRDPIYGGLTFTVNHGDKFQWRVQDVSMWQGHRAYIEIIDDGPGWIAVDQILFGDGGPPADVPNALLKAALDDPTLTRHLQGLFEEISEQWASGQLSQAKDAADRIALLQSLLPMIQGGEAPRDFARFTELQEQCRKIESDIRLSPRARR